MEKALNFLKEYKDVAFATVEENRPKIRVFQIMYQDGAELYFATAPHKEVYRQLKSNPAIELLGMGGNISVRIVGDAKFDVADEIGKMIYETNPVLPRLYKSYTDLVYFRVAVSQVNYYDLTPDPPLFESFNL